MNITQDIGSTERKVIDIATEVVKEIVTGLSFDEQQQVSSAIYVCIDGSNAFFRFAQKVLDALDRRKISIDEPGIREEILNEARIDFREIIILDNTARKVDA